MKHYLFIESESVFEAAGAPGFFALARELKQQGDAVEILLVQNGVMAARRRKGGRFERRAAGGDRRHGGRSVDAGARAEAGRSCSRRDGGSDRRGGRAYGGWMERDLELGGTS